MFISRYLLIYHKIRFLTVAEIYAETVTEGVLIYNNAALVMKTFRSMRLCLRWTRLQVLYQVFGLKCSTAI